VTPVIYIALRLATKMRLAFLLMFLFAGVFYAWVDVGRRIVGEWDSTYLNLPDNFFTEPDWQFSAKAQTQPPSWDS
jgi:hypothetical protein